ncbi:uncharacterized protein LOC135094180 [Scylla paramamosain]|uniref:uncharacterized protein LOC135094180 n=1 Tax=Scylla paramamosain TaxID=85552 RepID=UPI0030828ECC
MQDTPDTLTDLHHPCVRSCVEGDRRECHYIFTVEWYRSLSLECGDCPFNHTHCASHHCVFADGVQRPLVTVNRRLPGPFIHVCQWDEVVVNVENDLHLDSTSIHWHGIHQRGTPYMDGVPFLTQCPILPGTTFRYRFVADEPGTHYWHSHSGFQRTDGMFGALVVHQVPASDPHVTLYDTDDPKHTLVLTDWLNGLSFHKFINLHSAQDQDKPHTLLINGRGRFLTHKRGNEEATTPLHEVTVKAGKRHRFRTLSNSIRNCPIVISVDNHTLLVIAADGHPIQPITVDSLTIYGGERWDFVLTANQEQGTYWIKFQGLMHCGTRHKAAYQLAVLRYEGTEGVPDTRAPTSYHTTIREGFQLNTLDNAPGDGTFLTAAEMRSVTPTKEDISRHPDHTFWLNFNFYATKNPPQVMVHINGISFKLPSAPPLYQPNVDTSIFCNETSRKNCDEGFCHCPHVLTVKQDSLVEVVLVDESFVNHPFHLHGHSFYVIGMGQFGPGITKTKVQELDASGQVNRNFEHAPLKDTVTVPSGGYTVLRFLASNPGYWLFHCHLTFHVEMGMAMVFYVAGNHAAPPPPDDLPRCGLSGIDAL